MREKKKLNWRKLEYTGYYSKLLMINLFISFGNAAFLHLKFIDEYVIAGVLALLLFHFVLPNLY